MNSPARYSAQVRERAVRLALEHRGERALRGGWLHVPAPAGAGQAAHVRAALVAWLRRPAAVWGRTGVVSREHEETGGAAAGRVMSAMAAMAVIAVIAATAVTAAVADRIVAGFRSLRAIPFGGHP